MLKLHAGVSKKVGLPGFSSASASCHIEAELDSSLLQDHDGFQIVVRRVYESCERAVEDQIARLTGDKSSEADQSQPRNQTQNQPQAQPVVREVVEVSTTPAHRGARITTTTETRPSPRPATVSQVRAIRAICARRQINLADLLRERFGLATADDLGIRQASDLIDELKSDEPATSTANGNGAHAISGGAR